MWRNPGDVLARWPMLGKHRALPLWTSITDTETLCIPRKHLKTCYRPVLRQALAVLHWVMTRLGQNEGFASPAGKNGSVGPLARGLAHELIIPRGGAEGARRN